MIYLCLTRIKPQKSRRILLMRIIYVNSKKVMLYFLTICMLPKPHTRMSQIIIVLIPHKRNRRIELEIVYGCYDVMLKPLGFVISWIIYDWFFCHLWSNQWCFTRIDLPPHTHLHLVFHVFFLEPYICNSILNRLFHYHFWFNFIA